MRKIAIVNQKGGVGKTTTSVNLAAALAHIGKRVLLIDLDPQGHATLSLGIQPKSLKRSLYDLLTGRCAARQAVRQARPNLSILPSNLNLAGAESELANEIGRETILKSALADLRDLDFVLLDCPPSLGLLNLNGLCYADEVFIPMQCEFLSLNGVSLLVETIDRIQKRLNPTLRLTGVIACMYDPRRLLSREALAEVERFFAGKVFRSRVRVNVKLAEAPSRGQTVLEYAPESNGALDYLELAREVAAQGATAGSSNRPIRRLPRMAE